MNRQRLVDLTWVHINLSMFITQQTADDPEMRVRLEVADDLIMQCMDALRDE